MDLRRAGIKTVALLLCLALHAQQPAGEIDLEVKDPSGAAMEASGRLKNPAGGLDQSFQTNVQGTYRFSGLPYGRYRLEVSKSGFATQSVLIEVQSAAAVARIVTLPLAPQAAATSAQTNVRLLNTDLLPGRCDRALPAISPSPAWCHPDICGCRPAAWPPVPRPPP